MDLAMADHWEPWRACRLVSAASSGAALLCRVLSIFSFECESVLIQVLQHSNMPGYILQYISFVLVI